MQELELNDNLQSVDNLLTFLEKIFNGGSDFKYVEHPRALGLLRRLVVPVTTARACTSLAGIAQLPACWPGGSYTCPA